MCVCLVFMYYICVAWLGATFCAVSCGAKSSSEWFSVLYTRISSSSIFIFSHFFHPFAISFLFAVNCTPVHIF